MAGRVVPPGYAQLAPWWRNLFENHAAVQFDHRVLAVSTFLAVVGTWFVRRRGATPLVARRLDLALCVATLQLTLGISTLLLRVPVALGVAHQGGAALLLVSVILAWHADGLPGEAPHPATERVPTSLEWMYATMDAR